MELQEIIPAGSCRNLHRKNKHPVLSHGYYLGVQTNNQAEYLALIIGIFYAKKYLKYGDLLEIISDSELIVRQINGIYKIKNLELIKFNDLAKSLLSQVNYTIKHVLREQNTIADKNANKGLDKKLPLPAELQKFLEENEINI